MKRPMPFQIPCWVTGTQMLRREAWQIDISRASEERRRLAQRLGLLERLIQELAGIAGVCRRAESLKVPRYAQKAVCEVVARVNASVTEIPDLFFRIDEAEERRVDNWRKQLAQDGVVGTRVGKLSREEWEAVMQIATMFRSALERREQYDVARRLVDVRIALHVLDAGLDGAADALDAARPEALVRSARIPPHDTFVAVRALHVWQSRHDPKSDRRLGGRYHRSTSPGDHAGRDDTPGPHAHDR